MKNEHPVSGAEALRRWRLILGPLSEDGLSALMDANSMRADGGQQPDRASLGRDDAARDKLLQFLYSREYRDRQHDMTDRTGGTGPTEISAPEWLSGVRELFPRSTAETLQRQALERYNLAELILDPEVLSRATPSMELVKSILSFRSLLPPASRDAARRIIREVVEELEEKLAGRIKNTITGSRVRHLHGGRKAFHNLDWKTTIRQNLRHFDLEEQVLLLERMYFFQRDQYRLPWHIFIVVDQSGSMLDSVIYSAVIAAIFYKLKSLKSNLIIFDTSVVDLTNQTDDPVEVLLSVQLGGGTDIGMAMDYAARRITAPDRSMVVLITDFYEGGNPSRLKSVVQRLVDNGVMLLGLAALDERADPDYNHELAQDLVDLGMDIGAMTPDKLSEWVADVMAGRKK